MTKKRGAPCKYDRPVVVARICELIASSERGLVDILSADGMPGFSTFFEWIEADKSLADIYARAKILQTEYMESVMLTIADDGRNDYVTRQNKGGEDYQAVDHDHISRSRLRIETRKWLMGKLRPKKYGDKITNEHIGPDGGPIQSVSLTVSEFETAAKKLIADV